MGVLAMQGGGIWSLSLTEGWLPVTVYAVTVGGLAVLIVVAVTADIRRSGTSDASRSRRAGLGHATLASRTLCLVVGALAGGLVGGVGVWLVSDVFVVFGVGFGAIVIHLLGLGCAGLGLAVAGIVVLRRWSRFLAASMVPVTLLATALAVDGQYGEYPTLGSVVGIFPYPAIDLKDVHHPVRTVMQWRADPFAVRGMPERGWSGSAVIPAISSGFRARPAMIYLPPAALTDRPPRLPVLIMMSGQPGSPTRAFQASGLVGLMDGYAARHRGLAPIVVSPDQLGDATHNTLCADTPVYGNAETYLTRDVPDWIRTNLPADDGAAHWAVAGFSQGGTCSVQLGVRHPNLFGHMMPFASELKPTDGSEPTMIRRFFRGDRRAYEAQVPLLAMKARGHSVQTLMLSSGSLDASSMDAMLRLGHGARAIGMRVSMVEVPGRAHDWHAVHAAMDAELEVLCRDLGLDETARPIAWHSGIHVLSDGVSGPDVTDTTEGEDRR